MILIKCKQNQWDSRFFVHCYSQRVLGQRNHFVERPWELLEPVLVRSVSWEHRMDWRRPRTTFWELQLNDIRKYFWVSTQHYRRLTLVSLHFEHIRLQTGHLSLIDGIVVGWCIGMWSWQAVCVGILQLIRVDRCRCWQWHSGHTWCCDRCRHCWHCRHRWDRWPREVGHFRWWFEGFLLCHVLIRVDPFFVFRIPHNLGKDTANRKNNWV